MKFLITCLAVLGLFAPVAATADVMDDIQERGELIVGVSIFAPWTYPHEEGRLAGHEIDLATQIAEDLGVEPRFMQYNFESVFDALDRGDVDMIAAGVAMTPDRARRYYFSHPYMSSGIDVAVDGALLAEESDRLDLNSPERRIAVVEQTLAARVAGERLEQASIRSFGSATSAERAMREGESDIYVASVPETRLFVLRNPNRFVRPLDEPLVGGASGFVVRSGEERLLNFLNSWIFIREADGFLEDRYEHYFGSLDWVDDMAGR